MMRKFYYYYQYINRLQCFDDDDKFLKNGCGFSNKFLRDMHKAAKDNRISSEKDYNAFVDKYWEEFRQKKIQKKNNVILSPKEQYLVLKCKLRYDSRWSKVENDMITNSDLRRKISNIRNRSKYKEYFNIEKKLRSLESISMSNIYELFDDYSERRCIMSPDLELAIFVSAEHDINDLSDEEIIKLIEVESI